MLFTDKQSYLAYTNELRANLISAHNNSKKIKYEICATFKNGGNPAALQIEHLAVQRTINELVTAIHSAKRVAAAKMKLIADSHSKRLFLCPICQSTEFHQELMNRNTNETRTWVSKKDQKMYSGLRYEVIVHACIHCDWAQHIAYRFGKIHKVFPTPITF